MVADRLQVKYSRLQVAAQYTTLPILEEKSPIRQSLKKTCMRSSSFSSNFPIRSQKELRNVPSRLPQYPPANTTLTSPPPTTNRHKTSHPLLPPRSQLLLRFPHPLRSLPRLPQIQPRLQNKTHPPFPPHLRHRGYSVEGAWVW